MPKYFTDFKNVGGGVCQQIYGLEKCLGGVMPKYYRDLKQNVGGGGLCPNILDFKNVSGGGGMPTNFMYLKKLLRGRVMPKYFIDLKIVGVGVCQQILWT